MADAQANGLKRPHPNRDLQDGNAPKKPRSPAPRTNGTSSTKPDASKLIADARARAEAIRARLQTPRAGLNGTSPGSQSPSSGTPPPASRGPMSRVEEMRARVAALTGKNSNESQQRTASPTPAYPSPNYEDGLSRGRGGLSAVLHPSLLDSSKDSAASKPRPQGFADKVSKPNKAKKQLDLSGPQDLAEYRSGEYFDSRLGGQTATLRSRKAKQLIFNQKGKYIQQAAALRRQANLELLKQRVADNARKAGLQDDPTEKSFAIKAPDPVEWWDSGLLGESSKDYSGLDLPNGPKIDTEDSIITRFVQHPVPLEPPSTGLLNVTKPMYLTAKEQKKIRRQRRMEDLKEVQAKQRLGMIPAPAPKVKLGNLMRVLGEEAVKDPTAVEARVNREIAERAAKHVEMNEERKLTKEERHEKLETNKAQDAAKGVHLAVFKIDSLANGRQRFKVNKNAEQMNGTGLCIYHPKFQLVLFEAGLHSVTDYKKLMLNRIAWTENSPSAVREGNKEALVAFLKAEDADGALKDLSRNKCQLIFEGEQKGRSWRKWQSRVCETDKEAMELLDRAKMGSMWTLAKSVG